MFWLIGLIAVAFLLYWFVLRKFKCPKVGAMACVTGGVKSGKSTFSFYLAHRQYKRNLFGVKVRNWFRRLLKKDFQEEIPLFYSTIPLQCEHVLLTEDLLLREKRFAYKSVIWVDEASLIADSTYCKVADINDRLLLFNKLIAHETRGGMLVYNTQSIADLHFSVKRCLSETFYVHSTFKWIPFFLIVTIREERYSEDGFTLNTYNEDVEESLKRVIVPKSVWKKFDCYCYSVHTDNKEVDTGVKKSKDLKAYNLLSINPRHSLKVEKEIEECEKER
ncbi:MAG: hypothetical protein J6D30_04770 [Clostridia bacterium]|nr:hypothetical protein [Clostridia bacterium]